MRLFFFLIFVFATCLPLRAELRQDSLSRFTDEPRYWRALALSQGSNLVVWAFDRFVMKAPYAQVSGESMLRNLRAALVYDTDALPTNFVSHPYQGALYYTAARANGINWAGSLGYAALGSAVWEYFAEVEPFSVNDLFATSLGGMAFGEVTYRLSQQMRSVAMPRGWQWVSSATATLVSPMNGISRLLDGDWLTPSSPPKRVPLSMAVQTGMQFPVRGGTSPYPNVALLGEYGASFEEVRAPYDHFTFDFRFSPTIAEHFLERLFLLGTIYNKHWEVSSTQTFTVGLYQPFDYVDLSNPLRFQLAEAAAAAVGGGYCYQDERLRFDTHLYGDLILMGGVTSSYCLLGPRDYSFSQGFSLKAEVKLSCFNNRLHLYAKSGYYRLFTHRGYDPGIDFSQIELDGSNIQGDKGVYTLWLHQGRAAVALYKGVTVAVEYFIGNRHVDYHYHPVEEEGFTQLSCSVGYAF